MLDESQVLLTKGMSPVSVGLRTAEGELLGLTRTDVDFYLPLPYRRGSD
jgi:hypothetical protein